VTPPPAENLLRRLATVKPLTAFLVALVVLLAGMFLPGIVGGALLAALALAVAALTFTTWPVQTPPTRAVRLLLLTMLVAIAVAKIV
jgi:hypothetical protein